MQFLMQRMFPAIEPCMSAFYEVLLLKASGFFDWSEFCALLYFSFCAVKLPFVLVLWGRRKFLRSFHAVTV